MLSLKKICLQTLSRAAKAGNTAVLGPQILLPEIYPHYMRQVEIDSHSGSERCYLTTEADFYLLCKVYICVAKYLNLSWHINILNSVNDCMLDKENLCVPTIDKHYSDYVFPSTINIYYDYNIYTINGHSCINEYELLDRYYTIPKNLDIFVYGIPPLLVNLGLLFGRLIGPKYISKEAIESAHIALNTINAMNIKREE